MPRFNPVFESLPTYPQQELEKRKAAVLSEGKTLFDYGIGDPIEPVPEFIRTELCSAVKPHCGYPKVSGTHEVRSAIAGYLLRRYSLQLDSDTQIIPTSGAKEAVFHAPLLLIDAHAEDKTVLFPDPGYPAFHRGALFAGGESHCVPLTGDYIFRPWTLSPTILKQTRLLWLNSPHNPSGAVMSIDDLEKTYALCQEYDIVCFSDETYADIYDDEPPPSILQCGFTNVIAIHSLSKRSGMTGYRSGFMAGDPKLIERYKRLRANPGLVPQTFVNAAACAAWSDDAHVEARRVLFRDKKRLFLAFFDEVGLEVIGREASLYLWVKAPEGKSDTQWALELLEHGIVVTPGSLFSIEHRQSQYVRLAMVPDIETIKTTIGLWKEMF